MLGGTTNPLYLEIRPHYPHDSILILLPFCYHVHSRYRQLIGLEVFFTHMRGNWKSYKHKIKNYNILWLLMKGWPKTEWDSINDYNVTCSVGEMTRMHTINWLGSEELLMCNLLTSNTLPQHPRIHERSDDTAFDWTISWM